MPRRYRTAVLGGTFDRLHAGHAALFDAAFDIARQVGVGVTTDRFLHRYPKPRADRLRPYAVRRRSLARYLRRRYPGRNYWIVPLDDRFGRSIGPGVDVLVVSGETEGGGRAVNRERRRRGLSPVRVVVVPLVRGGDLRPIAGRRIREGEIDPEGRRLTPLVVGLAAPSSVRARLQASVRRHLRARRIRWRLGRARPVLAGARSTAAALAAARALVGSGAEIGFGLRPDGPRSRTAVLAGWDREGRVGTARGSFQRPADLERLVARAVRARTTGHRRSAA